MVLILSVVVEILLIQLSQLKVVQNLGLVVVSMVVILHLLVQLVDHLHL
jgi:hypothetical protein